MLHRLIRCAGKVFALSNEVLDKVTDGRQQPRPPTMRILKSALAMFWARLGSLNALETISAARFWKRWLGGAIGSADTMVRAHAVLDVGQLRDGLHQVYSQLKRHKALPLNLGLGVAVLDGHEQHARYLRIVRVPRAKRKDRTGRAHSVLPPASHAHALAWAWCRSQAAARLVGL